MYKQKYLKYKYKYLELKNIMKGGGYGTWTGVWNTESWNEDKNEFIGSFTGIFTDESENNFENNPVNTWQGMWKGKWEKDIFKGKFYDMTDEYDIEYFGKWENNNKINAVYDIHNINHSFSFYKSKNNIEEYFKFLYIRDEVHNNKYYFLYSDYFIDRDWIISNVPNNIFSSIYSFLMSYEIISKQKISFPIITGVEDIDLILIKTFNETDIKNIFIEINKLPNKIMIYICYKYQDYFFENENQNYFFEDENQYYSYEEEHQYYSSDEENKETKNVIQSIKMFDLETTDKDINFIFDDIINLITMGDNIFTNLSLLYDINIIVFSYDTINKICIPIIVTCFNEYNNDIDNYLKSFSSEDNFMNENYLKIVQKKNIIIYKERYYFVSLHNDNDVETCLVIKKILIDYYKFIKK